MTRPKKEKEERLMMRSASSTKRGSINEVCTKVEVQLRGGKEMIKNRRSKWQGGRWDEDSLRKQGRELGPGNDRRYRESGIMV